ncbi:MAG TPA: hypothetical protein VF650_14995 [Allosphingosinicella sp.]|jgi:hypothetical protein
MMPALPAALLLAAASAVSDPAGSSLSPWNVLPGDDLAGKTGRIALNGHQIFNQRAVPSRVVRISEAMVFEGISLPAGATLALAVNLRNKAEAWCALPAPGGHELTHRSPWGKRETRCFADTDGDGRLDQGYHGKLDLLGLPSVRTIKRRAALQAPVAFAETDPRSIEGFNVKATVFYFDLNKNGRSVCSSILPFHLDKAGSDPRKRRLAIALTRDDGTACVSRQSEIMAPDGEGRLPGKAGDLLSSNGASLRIDRISATGLEFTMVGGYSPYVIAGRTMTMIVDN